MHCLLVFSLALLPLTLATLEGRLPTSILPEHYDLQYLVNMGEEGDNFDFSGNVSIKVRVLEATQHVVLHSRNLTLGLVTVTSLEHGSMEVVEVKNDPYDFLNVTLATSLDVGGYYTVQIGFSGLLTESSFFLYPGPNAATYFSGNKASRAFPCFDEPAFKATFTITLGHNSKYTALSNMPLRSTRPIEGKVDWIWSEFEESVKMSTYLVAFVLTRHKSLSVEGVGAKGLTFRVWADEDNFDKIDFALDVGPKFLTYFENFCNISYSLPKMDMIAIPNYRSTAMEHWGLIIYSEFKLYYKPDYGSFRRGSSANTIAHELAHQWFGNLVTMKWYNHLWLSEGFARYMGNLADENIFPTESDSTAVKGIDSFLKLDSYEDSRSVSKNDTTIDKIREMFGPMTYNKGALVLRMSRLILGEDTFNRGVCSYLDAHKYSTAVEDDLWKELTQAGHEDGTLAANMSMKEVMSTWTMQPGYPLLTVTRNYGENTFNVQMERFLQRPSENTTQQCWWIPLTYTDQSRKDFEATTPKLWIPCSNEPQQIQTNIADKDWLLVNLQFSAFLRVNYDQENWLKLTETLNSPNYTVIPLLNRMQLVYDACELFNLDNLSPKVYFNLCKYLKYETNYDVWFKLMYDLIGLKSNLDRTAQQLNLKEYMEGILRPLYVKIGGLNGTPENSSDANNFFMDVVSYSCQFDVAECTDDALASFDEYMKNTSSLTKYESTILCTAMRHGDEEKWNFLRLQYSAVNETGDILRALSCTKNATLQQQLLEITLNSTQDIKPEDIDVPLRSLLRNPDAFETAQDFLVENAEQISFDIVESIMYTWAEQLKSDAELDKFKMFVESNKGILNGTETMVEDCLGVIRNNIKWQQMNLDKLADVLTEDSSENLL